MSLTPLRFKEDYDIRHPDDAERIVAIAADNGFEISLIDAAKAWDEYSDTMCAGWVTLNEEDDLVWLMICDKFERV